MLARIESRAEVVDVAKWAPRRTVGGIVICGIVILFVTAKSNSVSKSAVSAFQLPRVNREFVGLEVIVFANQRAVVAVGRLLAANAGRCFRF